MQAPGSSRIYERKEKRLSLIRQYCLASPPRSALLRTARRNTCGVHRKISAVFLIHRNLSTPPPLHHHNPLRLQRLALGPDSVYNPMETLASVWAHDPCNPCDLRDLRGKRHKLSSVWESHCVFNNNSPAGLMWTAQLSPHLQRNKQLHDTLLQREEQLARLQEENSKLREFLSSSFVRTLEEKAKKLSADGTRKLKRSLMYVDEGTFPNCGHQLMTSQSISKRVCRNLTAEFCSEYSDEISASSEPNLDLWVLQTLGLKDRDTIDTSSDSLSFPGYSLRSLVYDSAVTSSLSSGYTLNSFSPSVSTYLPPSANSYCHGSTSQPEVKYSTARCHETNCGGPAKSAQKCTTSPSQSLDFTATALRGLCDAPETVTRSYNTITANQSPPIIEELTFIQSPDRAEVCSFIASSQAQTLEGNPKEHLAYWSPLTKSQKPSQGTFQFSSPTDSTPVSKQPRISRQGCNPSNLSAGSQPPSTPQTPRSQADLAFSMFLSQSSSVKTHSFPQGQAFIRKDAEGRWNFTWVPRQGP